VERHGDLDVVAVQNVADVAIRALVSVLDVHDFQGIGAVGDAFLRYAAGHVSADEDVVAVGQAPP